MAIIWCIASVALLAVVLTMAYIKLAKVSEAYEIREDRLMPVPTPVPAPVDMWERYDVPLDDDVQKYIYDQCEAYGVDMPLVLAIIENESHFNAEAVSEDGHDFGLMQVRSMYHMQRCIDLGAWNLLDAKQNVRVGINYLAELIGWGNGIEYALSWYNGHGGEPCEYADGIIARAQEIERTREIVFSNG